VNFEFTNEKRGDPRGFRFGLNTTRANQLPQTNVAEPKEFAARAPMRQTAVPPRGAE
jgi:hypothetical protein